MKTSWWVVILVLGWGGALAQSGAGLRAQAGGAAEDVEVRFGFAGQIVADAWNPLRVTLRDLESAELVLELDVGDLRGGPRLLRYNAPLAGGDGLYTFEDDVYLPSWRTFSWLVRTPERVLASGGVERRFVDASPLHLVVSREVNTGTRFFAEDARVVDVTAADLPERAAAYSGIESLLVLGSDAPPAAGALVAGATSGSTVLLVGALGASHDGLTALVPEVGGRLGAGWLGRAEASRDAVQLELSTHPHLIPSALTATLISEELSETPEHLDTTWLLAGLGGYALFVLALLRFGGAPGLLAALLLAALLGASVARVRPAEPLLTRTRSLSLGAGGLALTHPLEALFSFPAQKAETARAAHPVPLTGTRAWTVGPESFSTNLGAYESVVLAGRPQLGIAAFSWRGAALRNETGTALGDVFVTTDGHIGGQQAPIPVDGTLEPSRGNLVPPPLYADLAPLLPPGSALARAGGAVYVALPERVQPEVTLPEVTPLQRTPFETTQPDTTQPETLERVP